MYANEKHGISDYMHTHCDGVRYNSHIKVNETHTKVANAPWDKNVGEGINITEGIDTITLEGLDRSTTYRDDGSRVSALHFFSH